MNKHFFLIILIISFNCAKAQIIEIGQDATSVKKIIEIVTDYMQFRE